MNDQDLNIPGLIGSAIFLIGFILAQKLISSKDPKQNKLGKQLNNFLGSLFIYGWFALYIVGFIAILYFLYNFIFL